MGFGDQSRPVEGVAPRQARPQRGWRQRVRYLGLLRRCRSHREASARLGGDESTVRRWRKSYPKFGARCDEIVAERYRQNADDLTLRAGEPRVRPIFFRGRQVGEQIIPDDRALMFLIKLEDARQARAEARDIQAAAGLRTMLEDGLEKAKAGLTTLDEVLRVTREG